MNDIIYQIEKSNQKICKLFKNFDLDSLLELPNIQLQSPQSLDSIPANIVGIYFLSHKKHGLLYVGKTLNLRKRWFRRLDFPGTVSLQHSMFLNAIELQDVTLSWLMLDKEITTIAEHHFIKNLKPEWNKVGNTKHYWKNNLGIDFATQLRNAQSFIGQRVKLFKTDNKFDYSNFLPSNKTIGTIADVFLSNNSIFDVMINWDGENTESRNKNLFYIFPKYEFFNQFYFV